MKNKTEDKWWELLLAWFCLISAAFFVFVVCNPLAWIFMLCVAILLQVMK